MQLVLTHAAEGIARLTERYRKPLLSAMLASCLEEVQLLELSGWDLLTKRAPDTAEGKTLDLLGKLVGQSRQGRTDDGYRLWISARILVNRSSGLTKQLLALAFKLTGVPVRVQDYYPAAFILRATEPIFGSDGVEIAKLLKRAKTAGVLMNFHWFDTLTTFRCSLSGSPAYSSARGFAEGRLSAVSDGRDMDFEPPPPPVDPGDLGGSELLVYVL